MASLDTITEDKTVVTTQIDHEVRIRLLEQIAEKIDKRFDKLDSKIDLHFYWVLGTIITLFGGIILHVAKLI